jgi:predicted RNA-binding protein YlqC (UPF0109 family)
MASSVILEPNYVELVKFLVIPFLEFPDALRVDCETYGGHHKVLVRLAFAASDKGRIFGRNGRTLQAIRTVLDATARLAGQAAYLEVYGGEREGVSTTANSARGTMPRPRRQSSDREA